MASTPDVAKLCRRLQADGVPQAARVGLAPAALDVMGGLGEQAGSLVLVTTLRTCVAVAVQPRTDERLVIRGASPHNGRERHEHVGTLADCGARAGGCAAMRWDADRDLTHAPIVAALGALSRSELSGRLPTGLTVEYEVAESVCREADWRSSLAAATLEAVASACDETLERGAILSCLERLDESPCLRAGGLRGLTAALLGQARGMVQLRRQAQHTLAHIELPAGSCLSALGVTPARPIRAERAAESLLAAAIGRRILVEIGRADGAPGDVTGGYLANIAPSEYVERYRDRIPQKISGREFVARFGPLELPWGAVDPGFVYKPRSRVEHIIYENRRVHDFAAAVVRAARTGDESKLHEAGELMYASHWSHSQRCGLGSLETDVVAQLIRQRGPAQGLFGSKLAGGWSGGLMVILMRDMPAAHAAVQDVADEASRRFGVRYRVITGSDAGASVQGARLANSPGGTLTR